MKSTANHQLGITMKTLTFVNWLLTCGLLPFILAEPTHSRSTESFMSNVLQNLVMAPLRQISDKLDKAKRCIHQCSGVASMPKSVPEDLNPQDCAHLYRAGYEESGVYKVYVYVAGYPVPVPVYCDMETDGGGWLVFQRRQDGSVDFNKNWTHYANGFGNSTGEFWLGNDLVHLFSDHEPQQLRVDLRDHEGHRAYAKYDRFYVGPQMSDYTLNVSVYSGNAGDSLDNHNLMKFSTKDRDNDASPGSCALTYKGAWWYRNCHHSNLNGLWAPTGQHNGTANSEYTNWKHWRGFRYSILFTEMKMRPLSF